MKIRLLVLACALASSGSALAGFNTIAEQGAALPYTVLGSLDDGKVEIRHGGYGSSAFADPNNNQRFYALTDRGPNADSANKGEKQFLVADYQPAVGLFEVSDQGDITLVKEIGLTNPDGQKITGLPNPKGFGATGEQAVDGEGNKLGTDQYGLDGEGLVVLADGSFYVSDEYGPHIVHFDAEGRELARISPQGLQSNSGELSLPAVFAKRRANRGMEGLAITPDHKTLVGIMQSTMYNPSKDEATNRTLTRIVTLNLDSGETHQYLYRQNDDNLSNSEIRALGATRFLVDERDGKFVGGDKPAQKHVYVIDLKGATDVGGDVDAENGLLVNGKTLEASTWEELEAAGIKPVEKQLAVDLVEALNYPHEKFEGMFLTADGKLAVLNDDDFALTSDKKGKVTQKMLPTNGEIDSARLYVLPVDLSL
ncbi:esterase-like activity of phytase family protein [Cardiobacteriaceae bacterium TAE3-ERU3]|nr:esterase-like activity of phytase family protein [Cardiobacteriaceae bacterium TAE3-ERU3]